jgi:hypothetical protein
MSHVARHEPVDEIRIDELGRLLVRPRTREFSHIYRSATGVHWDPQAGHLYSPTPKEWSHFAWYTQVAGAVASEYGYRLVLDVQTSWVNVPPNLEQQITRWSEEQ